MVRENRGGVVVATPRWLPRAIRGLTRERGGVIQSFFAMRPLSATGFVVWLTLPPTPDVGI